MTQILKVQYKKLLIIAVATISVLLIPFIAMQLTDAVNWKLNDFVVAGLLLFSTGLAFDLVLRTIPKRKHRVIAIFCLLIFLFLIWAELAVGIFGSPFAGS